MQAIWSYLLFFFKSPDNFPISFCSIFSLITNRKVFLAKVISMGEMERKSLWILFDENREFTLYS